MALISVRHLTFTYPQRNEPALTDVTLTVADGEFVLVAGPSGSGKSTLLRSLNGLIPHFSGGQVSGSITVGGEDPIDSGPKKLSRVVGFVSQDPEAQSVLDEVESEIAFALENAAVPESEMRVRVEETLELLSLTNLRHRSLDTLSGGERQRVAIAAALALRPSVLVLDEPTSQLDPQSAEDVLRALVRLNEDLGLTIILAEHRLERIARYSDRLVYLEEGRVIVDEPVREALLEIEGGPPVVQLARALNWRPLPLTVKEAKVFVRRQAIPDVARSRRVVAPAGSKKVLEIQNLYFSYNKKEVLKDISLSVNAGEVVALMGRNGAGKSTLLKCIVGLLRPKKGDIYLDDQLIRGREVAEICQNIGYLPQNPDDLLYAETVEGEFRETLHNHGLAEARARISEMLSSLELSAMAGHYPRDLSVGQRQRVAFGAVTITRPGLLLLDEPTRGLDLKLKAAFVRLWRRWLEDGAAMLLVTHDVELAAMIADRVVLLSQGEILADGRTHNVLGSSPHFAPQIARLFPNRGWLTVEDALTGLKKWAGGSQPAMEGM